MTPKEGKSFIRMSPKERVKAFEEAGVSRARFRAARLVLSLGFLAFGVLMIVNRWAAPMSDTLYSVLLLVAVVIILAGIFLNSRINRKLLAYSKREAPGK